MNYSLNAVESTAKRAARGAGYPWGLAEEAGKATRWLSHQGLEGCGALFDKGHPQRVQKMAPHLMKFINSLLLLFEDFTASKTTDNQ